MRELGSLLAARETATAVGFDPLNHRIRCYAHVINVCSSHVVVSVTSTSKAYLSNLKVPIDSNYGTCADSDDESDGDGDANPDVQELDLPDVYDDEGNARLRSWFAGIKRDPLRRARRIIRLLRSSDQRREGFRKFIQDGNENKWFKKKGDDGKLVYICVPELQPLRDVKTRWDSVYMMLQRLRCLRPVRRLPIGCLRLIEHSVLKHRLLICILRPI
jgi:hypothetical protein